MADNGVRGLVFDLPEEEWTAEIRRLRAVYDRARLHFPIEITVAGSSGLGWFSSGQATEFVLEQVRGLTRYISPIQCNFAGVEVFPDSRVHYLALEDHAPFHAFQQALAASRLQFEMTPFSYTPHCTIVALPEDAAPSAYAELAAFPVPRRSVILASVSLYSVNVADNSCRFIARIPLGA